ncbi:MAG: VOC family protein [Azoarcus sp.]|nr:VOC family protein [Azoarcus sp.]
MDSARFGIVQVKVIALAVADLARAHRFYGETLGWPPAFEGDERVGYQLGSTIFMLKADGPGQPSEALNPRITLETTHARRTETELRASGVAIGDPVAVYDDFLVGSFLDSEGNKLWFCSANEAA